MTNVLPWFLALAMRFCTGQNPCPIQVRQVLNRGLPHTGLVDPHDRWLGTLFDCLNEPEQAHLTLPWSHAPAVWPCLPSRSQGLACLRTGAECMRACLFLFQPCTVQSCTCFMQQAGLGPKHAAFCRAHISACSGWGRGGSYIWCPHSRIGHLSFPARCMQGARCICNAAHASCGAVRAAFSAAALAVKPLQENT